MIDDVAYAADCGDVRQPHSRGERLGLLLSLGLVAMCWIGTASYIRRNARRAGYDEDRLTASWFLLGWVGLLLAERSEAHAAAERKQIARRAEASEPSEAMSAMRRALGTWSRRR